MVRVSRMVTAESAVPRMSAGIDHLAEVLQRILRVNGMNFTSGDQPHQIDGNTITMVPIQKLGTASIRIEKERADIVACRVLARSAE